MSVASDAIAIPLIRHYESCDLHPYQKGGDVPTIGWGNTIYKDGRRVALDDDPITQAEADDLFAYWLSSFAAGVEGHAVGAKPNELAAFTSLAYNIGQAAFNSSSTLRFFLSANKAEAANRIELWNRSGGKVLKGLQRRRRAERLVFEGTSVTSAIMQSEKAFP